MWEHVFSEFLLLDERDTDFILTDVSYNRYICNQFGVYNDDRLHKNFTKLATKLEEVSNDE